MEYIIELKVALESEIFEFGSNHSHKKRKNSLETRPHLTEF